LKDAFQVVPCPAWNAALQNAKSTLLKQGAFAIADIAIASAFAGMGTMVNASSAAAKGISLNGAVIGSELAIGEEFANRGISDDVICQLAQACGCSEMQNKKECMDAALTVYTKIAHKHPTVDKLGKVFTVVASTAPVVGILVDLFTLGATAGAGTTIGGFTGLGASGCNAALNAGHLGVSCVQHARISKCFNAVCATPDEP